MDWNSYHEKRRGDFLNERGVKTIKRFDDDDKIALAEAGATCYHPNEDGGWSTREWLEDIHCVHHHGCCSGCKAIKKCKELSK